MNNAWYFENSESLMPKLTAKQQKFIECYNGNAKAAAVQAGYSQRTARSIGSELLTKPNIRAILEERQKAELAELIANRQERQKFWTSTMRNDSIRLQDRLKASELLGKTQGDFIEKPQSRLNEGIAERLKRARLRRAVDEAKEREEFVQKLNEAVSAELKKRGITS